MLLFDKRKFKASVIASGLTMNEVARYLNLNPSTLYRKINGSSDFTCKEIQKLKKTLCLDMSKISEIFFA